MPPTLWDDPDEERQQVAAAQGRMARVQSYRTTASANQAQQLSRIVATYPHLSPGTAVPLAMAGETADSELTAQVAVKEAKKNKKKRGLWGAVTDRVTNPTHILGDVANLAGEAAELGTDILKPVVRTGAGIAFGLAEEGMGAVRAVAANAGTIAAGAASGFVTGAATGLLAGGIGAIPGAIGGTIIGAGAGAVAQMKGVKVEGEGWRPQSTLLTSLTGGGSMGQGYLPGGTAAVEAIERRRETGMVGNHAFTPGRFFAATAFDEDTAPYKLLSGVVDAGINWKLDPTSAGGKALKKAKTVGRYSGRFENLTSAQKARQAAGEVFEETATVAVGAGDEVAAAAQAMDPRAAARMEAGIVDGGHRPSVIRENADAWLKGAKGVKTKQMLADINDYEDMRKVVGKDVDNSTIIDLLDAKTPDSIDQVLAPKLGIDRGLESSKNIGKPMGGIKVSRVKDDIRMLALMPTGAINVSKPEEAIEQFTRMQQAANIPYERISKSNERLGRAIRNGNIEEAEGVILRDLVGHSDGILTRAGADPELANKLTNRWLTINSTLRRDLIDDIGRGSSPPGLHLDGEVKQLASPHLMAEAMENLIEFSPEMVRNIRRSTASFGPVFGPAIKKLPVVGDVDAAQVFTNRVWTAPVDSAAWITNKVWKVAALARGSYVTRNIGEAQARIGAAGYSSMFRHPMDYMAWVAGDETAIGRIFQKFGKTTGRGDVDIMGEAWNNNPIALEKELRGQMNHYAESLNSKGRQEGWFGGSSVKAGAVQDWQRGAEGHIPALFDRMERLHNDPLARRFATSNQIRQGEKFDPMKPLADPELRDALDEFATLTRRPAMRTKGGARIPEADALNQWMENTAKTARETAGNSTEIWDAIASGELKGFPMRLPNGKPNPKFREALTDLVNAGHGPNAVTGAALKSAKIADKWNNGVTWIFDLIDTKPMGKFTYGPVHKQAYWDEAQRGIMIGNRDAQRQILEAAREAKMPKDFIAQLKKRAASSEGELNADALNGILNVRAADISKKLLYQSSEKSQLQDIMRVAFPFMGAQMNSLRTWTKLGLENPGVPARVGQIFNGARGTGTFYKDPQTGEEMFAYPGSKLLTSTILGMPIPLGGPVAGLNMFGSGLLPGAGPVVQIATRELLKNKPRYDQLREILDPMGDSAKGSLPMQFAPPWMKKMLTAKNADEDDRAFGDAVFQIYSAGLSIGKYSNKTPEEMAAGLEDAKGKARTLYFVQGAAVFLGAPANPAPEFVAADKTGKWHMTEALAKEYRTFYEEDPHTAMEAFVTKFGPDVTAILQGGTSTQGAILPEPNKPSGDWARANPEIAEKYGNVYGLFAPDVDTDDFDSKTWAAQLRNEERWPLDPEQRAKLANNKLATTAYYNVKDRFGPYPTKPQKDFLRQIREALRREYPGFDEAIELPAKVKTEDKIKEVTEAVNDPALADNPAAVSIKAYLSVRGKLNEMAKSAGYASVAKAKGMAGQRALLRQMGEALVREQPAFSRPWEMLFRNEISIDEEEETVIDGSTEA